jgi:hypothetical protein
MKLSISTHHTFGWMQSYNFNFKSLVESVVCKYNYSPCIYSEQNRNQNTVIGHHNILIFDVDNKDAKNIISINDMYLKLDSYDFNFALVPTMAITENLDTKDRNTWTLW